MIQKNGKRKFLKAAALLAGIAIAGTGIYALAAKRKGVEMFQSFGDIQITGIVEKDTLSFTVGTEDLPKIHTEMLILKKVSGMDTSLKMVSPKYAAIAQQDPTVLSVKTMTNIVIHQK